MNGNPGPFDGPPPEGHFPSDSEIHQFAKGVLLEVAADGEDRDRVQAARSLLEATKPTVPVKPMASVSEEELERQIEEYWKGRKMPPPVPDRDGMQ